MAASFYKTDIVIQAIFITLIISGGLATYGITTKNDFSSMGPYLFLALIVLVCGSFFRLLFPFSPVVNTIWACFGALL